VSEKERRRYERIPLDLPGVIRIARGPELNTQLTEISEGGAQCSCPHVVSLGVKVELRFVLSLAIAKECLLSGRVQHYHKHNEVYALGIEFIGVTPDIAEAIRAFVRGES
jgi:c-di-GMP-binding flagellar brake protein YcgR